MARPTRRRRGCFAYRHPEAMRRLLKLLADHSAAYLIRQIEAGADAVQIFDSWSGVLGRGELCRPSASSRSPKSSGRSAQPTPMCRSSPFPRAPAAAMTAFGRRRVRRRSASTGPCRCRRRSACRGEGAVQGNLDPQRLVAGGEALQRGHRRDTGCAGRWPAGLQSRPRHHAGNADRPRRGDGRAGRRSARR